MPDVYLGLGSNVRPHANLKLAVRELSVLFLLKAISPVYRNQAVGFDGEDFLNAVVLVETDRDPAAVCAELERIHEVSGRKRGPDSFVSRSLDIDLLLYGDAIIDQPPVRVPRSDILEYDFVLRPLVDIAPGLIHPLTGLTMAEHWRSFEAGGNRLAKEHVDF